MPDEADQDQAQRLVCRVGVLCSGLMKLQTYLGENARQIRVSDDQTTPFLFC